MNELKPKNQITIVVGKHSGVENHCADIRKEAFELCSLGLLVCVFISQSLPSNVKFPTKHCVIQTTKRPVIHSETVCTFLP